MTPDLILIITMEPSVSYITSSQNIKQKDLGYRRINEQYLDGTQKLTYQPPSGRV